MTIVFSISASTLRAGEDGDLFENEDLAVLCAAMYEYQFDLKGFEKELLKLKRDLIGRHMLEITATGHQGDRDYFEKKVAAVKASLYTLPEEGRAELGADRWSENGNPCDQIVAATFILRAADAVAAGGGQTLEQARLTLQRIYPWKDRYARILDQGLDVQYEKARARAKSSQSPPGSPSTDGSIEPGQ